MQRELQAPTLFGLDRPAKVSSVERVQPTFFGVAMNANDIQVGGDHYKNLGVEPWSAMQAWLSEEQFIGFLVGSAIAYLARYNTPGVPGKGGVPDIKKAQHYLTKAVEVLSK